MPTYDLTLLVGGVGFFYVLLEIPLGSCISGVNQVAPSELLVISQLVPLKNVTQCKDKFLLC